MQQVLFEVTADIWTTPAFVRERSKALGDKKIGRRAFCTALRELNYPDQRPEHLHYLFTGLDYYGCGFVSREDLEWLDKWEPPTWLSAKANQGALEEIKELLLREHGHFIKAWRRLLDVDNIVLPTRFEKRYQRGPRYPLIAKEVPKRSPPCSQQRSKRGQSLDDMLTMWNSSGPLLRKGLGSLLITWRLHGSPPS